jgi:hypothetical protein
MAAPGYTLQLRLAAKAGQCGVSVAIPNAQGSTNLYAPYFIAAAQSRIIAA